MIPILMSFFQNRMVLKWHGKMSSVKKDPASGPQGSTLGILEYLSASNNNTDNVAVDDRFISLLMMPLSSIMNEIFVRKLNTSLFIIFLFDNS